MPLSVQNAIAKYVEMDRFKMKQKSIKEVTVPDAMPCFHKNEQGL